MQGKKLAEVNKKTDGNVGFSVLLFFSLMAFINPFF